MTIPPTRASLLLALQSHDRKEEAWRAFDALYRGVILGWGLRRGLTPEAAEDLTQDVLLKLFQELPRNPYDLSRGKFRGWLKAVVNNALTDHWRRQRVRVEQLGDSFIDQLTGAVDPRLTNELCDELESRAAARAAEVLDRVRAKVHETTWQAAYQHLVERRPAAAVASELGFSVGNVYKASHRVKQLLVEESRHG